MTLKPFEIKGLGKCLVGTYTVRHLTKYFQCSPEQLLFIGSQSGIEFEFISYLLKFSRENFLIQSGKPSDMQDLPIASIDSVLDENPLETADYNTIVDALCMSVHRMTKDEFIAKIEKATKGQEKENADDDLKKNTIGTTTGKDLTNSLGDTE